MMKVAASSPAAAELARFNAEVYTLNSVDQHSPADGSHGGMPVLGPDLSSRPATQLRFGQVTSGPARQEALILKGAPSLHNAAASAILPSPGLVATRPATTTQPTLTTQPTTTAAQATTHTATSSAPAETRGSQ
jgi:hypothetical protein